MLKVVSFFLVGILSLVSFAAGPSTGGGGDVIRLPDDSVVLADPFLSHGGNQPNNMPPLRSLNPRLLQMAQRYASKLETFKGTEILAEIVKLTRRDTGLRFYSVRDSNELNMFCASGGRKSYNLPNGAKVEQAACTAGKETFLVEPLFLKLTLRQQVLLLIHERLTTLRDQYGGKNYSAIARFTTGLNIYFELLKEQEQKNYRHLSSQDANTLNEFYNAADEINYRNSNNPPEAFAFTVHPYGGGRLDDKSIASPSALITAEMKVINSEIYDEAILVGGEKNKRISGSSLYEKAQVIDSELVDAKILESANVRTSVVKKSVVGENSQIIKSSVINSKIGQRALVQTSSVSDSNIAAEAQIIDSTLVNSGTLGMAVIKASKIENSIIEKEASTIGYSEVGNGSKFKNVSCLSD